MDRAEVMQLTKRTLVVVALALLVLGGSGAASGGRSGAATGSRGPFLWGAWIGRQFTGSEPPWNWKAVTDFEARNAGGKRLTAVHWGVRTAWGHSFNYWLGPLNRVRRAHAVSVMDMYSESVPLREIADGTYDAALRAWASEARRWRHSFLLRFDWEMNGRWFPWGTKSTNQNTPADFVAAWRHMHDIFTSAGARNVRWVWCPNANRDNTEASLSQLYPGRSYVDWTCLDGYNTGKPWLSFTKIFSRSYHLIRRLAPTKPMIIGEVASTEHNGSKARWISGMFRALATRFPHIRGLLWYDKYGSSGVTDWPIETSRTSSAAFSRGLALRLSR
ncbi:MAG TPA: glycosyl hydrolase [Gaiellaceae bacterium]